MFQARGVGRLMLAMLLAAALVACTLMALVWVIHLALRNAGVVDAGWAAGVPLLAILYALMGPGYPARKWLFAAMAAVWGFRLALYLLLTRVLGHEEEGRYKQLRKDWGGNIPLKFFLFFQFQGLLDVLLSLPFLLACLNPAPGLSALEGLGLAVWVVAFAGESLSDWQLSRFKSDPASRGKTCRAGLWRYSRHPNYFFEWLIWCANFLYALASPFGWIAIVCPALMLFFLFRVTGIPATEAQALRTKGDDYREYQRTTSAFVPWFPRATGR